MKCHNTYHLNQRITIYQRMPVQIISQFLQVHMINELNKYIKHDHLINLMIIVHLTGDLFNLFFGILHFAQLRNLIRSHEMNTPHIRDLILLWSFVLCYLSRFPNYWTMSISHSTSPNFGEKPHFKITDRQRSAPGVEYLQGNNHWFEEEEEWQSVRVLSNLFSGIFFLPHPLCNMKFSSRNI